MELMFYLSRRLQHRSTIKTDNVADADKREDRQG